MVHDDIDPEVLEELRRRAKAQLRKRLLGLRSATPARARAERSRVIVERVVALEAFAKARSVASFWPMLDRGEVDVRELDAAARAAGKRVYYPFIQPAEGEVDPLAEPRIGFRLTESSADLEARGQRFVEPPPDAPEAAPGEIDLVVVPALGVSEDGHRLGYGWGFYDRALPRFCPPATSVAVAYGFELLAEVPHGPRDVACDVVVTDQRCCGV